MYENLYKKNLNDSNFILTVQRKIKTKIKAYNLRLNSLNYI